MITNILALLRKARICYQVVSSAANGVPLGAAINEKYFKEIFLDVGLCLSEFGLSLHQINNINEIVLINNGAVAEQVVGQLLRTINPPYIETRLFYWLRDEKGSNAELDYVIQHNNLVIPIEVKAGTPGTLEPLHLFMGSKKYAEAKRINSDMPNVTEIKTITQKEQIAEYTLMSIPFYLLGQTHRLLDLIYVK